MDFSLPSNRLMVGLVAASAVAAVVVWATTDAATEVLWAPVHLFAVWALVREIDPDHHSTAIVGAVVAGLWALTGLGVAVAIAAGGFALAARLVLGSTGRRPLGTDLIGVALIATGIAFTAVGWVAGFGIALAIYIDDRMAEEQRPMSVVAAALAALGASGVATLNNVFPQEIPDVRPLLVAGIGVLALLAVTREPEMPHSLVDSRRKTPLSQARLHAARGLVGVLVFVAAILSGPDAVDMGPAVIALAIALVSNEVERIRRRLTGRR